MTSKEALEKLKQYNYVGLTGDNTLFEPIENDLKLLDVLYEIFTKDDNINLTYLDIEDGHICIDTSLNLEEDKINLIRNWLTKSKNNIKIK